MNDNISKAFGSSMQSAKYMHAMQVVCGSFSDSQLSAMVRKTPQ